MKEWINNDNFPYWLPHFQQWKRKECSWIAASTETVIWSTLNIKIITVLQTSASLICWESFSFRSVNSSICWAPSNETSISGRSSAGGLEEFSAFAVEYCLRGFVRKCDGLKECFSKLKLLQRSWNCHLHNIIIPLARSDGLVLHQPGYETKVFPRNTAGFTNNKSWPIQHTFSYCFIVANSPHGPKLGPRRCGGLEKNPYWQCNKYSVVKSSLIHKYI